MRDLQILPVKTAAMKPCVLGRTTSQGFMLYQKIVILILSYYKDAYREAAGSNLPALLKGANTPMDQVLLSMGTMACNQVKSQLAPQDAQKIDSLSASAQNGQLDINLTLVSGQTYTGAIL